MSTVESFRSLVENGATQSDIPQIQALQRTFQNLSEEEQQEISEIIADALLSATDPAKTELISLRTTIQEYQSLGASQEVGTVNLSTGLPSSTEVQATLPDSEYTKLAQDVIQFTPESSIKNNRNIFLFQTYFAQTDLGSEISVDGVSGPQTVTAISYHSRATAIFLRELGFKGLDGGTLNIRDTFTPDITAAIQSAFGVTVASQVETPEVAVTPRVEVAPALRQVLAEKIIGTPLTAEKIRAYQAEHNIGADGILGNETYFEMRAGEVVVGLTGNMENLETQETVLQVLQYGNPEGINYTPLMTQVGRFREQEKDNAQYTTFFRKLDAIMQNPASNPHTPALEEQANRPNSAGGSVLGDIPKLIEGEITPQEYLERNKGTGILVGIAAFIFFGNKIPGIGDIPGMGSWFGRIAWLLGGTILGGGDLLKYGLEKAGEGIGAGMNYTRSPEAQTLFENGKTGFLDFFKTTLPEFFTSAGTTLGDQFTTFVTNFETKNEERKNTPEFIENISEKGSIILSDATFLNASKEQIVQAQATGSLAGILSDTGLQKINALGISDEDIKNYLNLYILPRFTDDDTFVRDIFMTTGVLDAGQEAQLTISGNYIENPELNLIITQEISNLRLVGSEAQRLAATQLALALQTTSLEAFNGTFGTFSLTNHPALTPDEKQKFEVLLRKLTVIFTQEKYIAEQIGGIGTIALQSGSETEFTLTTRLEQLEGIKIGFQLQTADIQSVGLTAERFSSEKFEEIYAAKRNEILQVASTLGINVLTLTNGTVIQVNTEIESQAAQSLQAENSQKLEEIITGLEPLPLETATPIEFRAYFDAKQGDFEILEQIVTGNAGSLDGTHEFELKTRAEVGVAMKNTLGERYLIVRQRYVDEISQLQSEITGISETNITEVGYQSARTKLQEISGKYYDLGSQIVEGITVRDTYTALESYFTGAIVFPAEKNSVTYLDGVFPTTPLTTLNIESIKDGIESKIIALETAFTVDVDMTQIDISNPQTVRDVVNLLGGKKMVVDTFLKESIQSGKYREVATQFQTIQSLYITAIGTATSLTDVEKIITEYRDIVQPYVVDGRSSIWQTGWEAVKDIFTEQDEVEKVYVNFSESNGQVLSLLAKESVVQNLLERSGYYIFDELPTLSQNTKDVLLSFDGNTTTLQQVLEALSTISQGAGTFGDMDSQEAKKVYDSLQILIQNQ